MVGLCGPTLQASPSNPRPVYPESTEFEQGNAPSNRAADRLQPIAPGDDRVVFSQEDCRTADADDSLCFLEFVYINANVGGSSGGHTALKLGERVFHYQMFPDGIFRLVRDYWPAFRQVYNDLENRTIYIAPVRVNRTTYLRIQDALVRHYFIQNRYLEYRLELDSERRLLNALLQAQPTYQIPGAGFFAFPVDHSANAPSVELRLINTIRTENSEPQSLHSVRALTEIGSDVRDLQHRIRAGHPDLTQRQIALGNALQSPPVTAVEFPYNHIQRTAEDAAPAYPYFPVRALTEYRENLAWWAALDIILNERVLRSDALMAVPDAAVAPGAGQIELSATERRALGEYARILEQEITHLLHSNRPDGGYTVLILMARLQAIQYSLRQNRLYVLDPFPDAHLYVPADIIRQHPEAVRELTYTAGQIFAGVRTHVFSRSPFSERDYAALERTGGQYTELIRAYRNGGRVRVLARRTPPTRAATMRLPRSDAATAAQIRQSLSRLQEFTYQYSDYLRHRFDYNLIQKNCATEMSRRIQTAIRSATAQARSSQTQADIALPGEPIAPGERFSFIPAAWIDLVESRYQVEQVIVLPSYRHRQLEGARASGNNLVDVREGNTLTTRLYTARPGDSTFLIFTENLFWSRPLAGLINLSYAGLHTVPGVFMAPFDAGETLEAAGTGMFYSLPEILFFNIRKGSYEYVPNDAYTPYSIRAEEFSNPDN